MSIIDRQILTVIEPALSLDKLEISDLESGTDNSDGGTMPILPSSIYNIAPLIVVNKYTINPTSIISYKLKIVDFYPTIKIAFKDEQGLFTARHFPKDGDLIQVYIKSQGSEKVIKPIRIDFSIVSIYSINTSNKNIVKPEYVIEGRINIPNLFTDNIQFYEGTSWESLLNIAESLEIGFASNIDDTVDSMTWINPNDNNEQFIHEIISNSYLDDQSFITAYIDPFYYLNVIEINRMLAQDTEIDENFIHTLNSAEFYGNEVEDTKFPNMLSNLETFKGTSRYIESYKPMNDSGLISRINGYKRYVQFWDEEEREFVSEFIDPISDPLSGNIALTKGRIIDGEPEGPLNEQLKYKYIGVQSENVHTNFVYSMVHNFQNLSEIKKIGLIVEVSGINISMVRFNRVYCAIYEESDVIKANLTDTREGIENQNKRQNIEDESTGLGGDVGIIRNEYLSGFYLIGGIEYFQIGTTIPKTRYYLYRREAYPTT